MREEAVSEFLARARSDWAVVQELIRQERLVEIGYEGSRFYMRKLS
jgi:hypothetical protein